MSHTAGCSHFSGLLQAQSTITANKADSQGTTTSQTPASDIDRRYARVVRWGAQAQGVKRRKTAAPSCQACSNSLSKPWACLTCSFIGCLPLTGSTSFNKECMRNHFSKSTDCSFAIEPHTGSLYCSDCNDTIYPDHLDGILRQTRIQVEEEADLSREGNIAGRGRGRAPWKDLHEAAEPSPRIPCGGLRPLLNLSQTCFLSAILQALIHNPLLKAYFLSDKHNRHVCPNGAKGLATGKPIIGNGVDGSEIDREKGCMCCEMDRAFEEFHNEDRAPFGPVTMLYSMWHASAELEGHGQQDAHSFFLAALDQLHAHAKGQLSSCSCIAHQTFAGSLLSTVTCSNCNETSTTVDPILDIQLDFPLNPDPQSLTLAGMLRRFCAEERVGDMGRGYECSACGGGAGVMGKRKLSIKKLAPVLSFQLKRFAHNATSTKVELAVKFPSKLNMRPYVHVDESSSASQLPDSMYAYDLFAVVTHEGKLDNGHYWADVRQGDEWWHCDDDKVTPTTLGTVLSQKAYMLFYVKRTLAYGQSMAKLLAESNGNTNDQAPSLARSVSGKKMPNGKSVWRDPGLGIGGGSVGEGGMPVSRKNVTGGRSAHRINGMAI